MSELYIRNRQRSRKVDVKLLQNIAAAVLERSGREEYRMGILLVGDREMTRLNEGFLRHAGSTDVIAFGYTNHLGSALHGEVFICMDEAVRQARRYRTSWQKEIVRYLVHGLLHFQGHSDDTPVQRRKMKAVENAWVHDLARQFCLSRLLRKPRVTS